MFAPANYERYLRLLSRNTVASNLEVLHHLQQEEHWIIARALAWILERHIQRIGHWKVAYAVDLGRVVVGFKTFQLPGESSGIQAIHATIYLERDGHIEVVDEKPLEAPTAQMAEVYRTYLLEQVLNLTQQLLPLWDA